MISDMGGGNFHLHLPHHGKKEVIKDIPKGCLAIMVGGEEEEQRRFVIPVLYFNHPLFMQLLKEAEEEYGFEQKGTITIPCHVDEFLHVQDMIEKETSHHHHHHHHHHHNNHHHHHHHLVGCFRA